MPRLDAERIALWRRWNIASTELQRKVDAQLMEDHDLPLAWFECLGAIRDAGGTMRVHELSEALQELPSSLSRRLDRLEEEGMVRRKRTPLPDDRRAVSVSLTKAGREVWRDANITFRRMVQHHFAVHLTETDIAAIQRVLGKLA
ncbi:MAG: MarR family transcriptional regulator [Actinobacteria bacterium]|nr:MarR family transcriptional regulator [Actinomycetota bacterium]